MFCGRSKDFPTSVRQFCDSKPTHYRNQEVESKVVRAAIMTSDDIVVWKLANFSSQDVCSVLVKIQEEEIIIVSAYLDINYGEVMPECLVDLL